MSAGVRGRTKAQPGRVLAVAPGRGAGGPPEATSAQLYGRWRHGPGVPLHAWTQQQGLNGRWRSFFQLMELIFEDKILMKVLFFTGPSLSRLAFTVL